MTTPQTATGAVHRAGTVATPQAQRYLTQLCKHFQHKCPVTHDDKDGRISFTSGDCQLHAADGVLTLALDAADDVAATQLQDVIVRHLERFAFREALRIEWGTA